MCPVRLPDMDSSFVIKQKRNIIAAGVNDIASAKSFVDESCIVAAGDDIDRLACPGSADLNVSANQGQT